MDKFKIGDVVCLTFDEGKKFLVEEIKANGDIELCYFNESQGKFTFIKAPTRYIKHITQKEQ